MLRRASFERIGRWVDHRIPPVSHPFLKGEYKTMDDTFMESVWFVFQTLYDSGKIYQGFKVMPFSTGCGTPLSHNEAKMNYKDTTDPTIIAMFKVVSTQYSKFQMKDDFPTYLLAWTTTPWTLPSNMALCTNDLLTLIEIFDADCEAYLILSRLKFESTYAKQNKRFKITNPDVLGFELVNAEYQPPFDYFYNRAELETVPIEKRSFRVVMDGYVKDSGEGSGTGFVHLAPVHGEDDFRVCCLNGIIDQKNEKKNMIDVVNDDGLFDPSVVDFAGMYVKTADKDIIKNLKLRGLCFETKQYTHSYPFCWRTQTPLIYKAITGWFVDVANPEFKRNIVATNKKINWVPEFVGSKRFGNWIEDSPPWCISRSRFWGTCIPVWASADGLEMVCVGSTDELKKLSGVDDITDLHMEFIDKIEIPSKQCRGMLRRVDGVLDCWFESGAVPYGQVHYPFENRDTIDANPDAIADFVCESIDQVRGWFYSLNAESTALFNKPAFANVIVTGIVCGSDGRKMSKSEGNYIDPFIVVNKYGADAVRLYLLSSPVVKAESIKFDSELDENKEYVQSKFIESVGQNSVIRFYNVTLFMLEKIESFMKEYPTESFGLPTHTELSALDNILDRWIVNKTGLFLKSAVANLDSYQMFEYANGIFTYVDQLANWYLKMNRHRLKGTDLNQSDWKNCLQTLLFVVYQFSRIASPIIPFITETVYQKIKKFIPNAEESIHYTSYPTEDEFIYDADLEPKFDLIQKVITLIREGRDVMVYSQKRPIYSVEIGCEDDQAWDTIQDILSYIRAESNVMNLTRGKFNARFNKRTEVNFSVLTPILKEQQLISIIKVLTTFITKLTSEQLVALETDGFIVEPTTGYEVVRDHIRIIYAMAEPDKTVRMDGSLYIKIDPTYNDEIEKEHYLKMVLNMINMHRKNVQLKPWDVVKIYFKVDSTTDVMRTFINTNKNLLLNKITLDLTDITDQNFPDDVSKNGSEHVFLDDTVTIWSKVESV